MYSFWMRNKEQYLPGMNHVLCGRPPKTSLAQMEAKLRSYRESSLSELMSVFGAWVPFARLQPKSRKANSRCRDYSLAVEFYFRQIKTTMGMEKLRCLTPEMVRSAIRVKRTGYIFLHMDSVADVIGAAHV